MFVPFLTFAGSNFGFTQVAPQDLTGFLTDVVSNDPTFPPAPQYMTEYLKNVATDAPETTMLALVDRYGDGQSIGIHSIHAHRDDYWSRGLHVTTVGLFSPENAALVIAAFVATHGGGGLLQTFWETLPESVIELIAVGSPLLPIEWKSTPTEHGFTLLTTESSIFAAQETLFAGLENLAASEARLRAKAAALKAAQA